MTITELVQSLDEHSSRASTWTSLLGTRGAILGAWSAQANAGATDAWSDAYEIVSSARSAIARYLATLQCEADVERIHRNLCGLMAVRAGGLDLASNHVSEGQARHWLNWAPRRQMRTLDRKIVVPVALRYYSDAGSIAEFRISRHVTATNEIWEDPEIALSPFGVPLLRTVRECTPPEGAFSWSVSVANDVTDMPLSGTSCGGALRIAFRALRDRLDYRHECLILADQTFCGVKGVVPKLEAALESRIQRVLLGRLTDLPDVTRRDYQAKLELLDVDSEEEALPLATRPKVHSPGPRTAQPRVPIDRSLPGVNPDENPYVGPRPFLPEESDLYHRGVGDWQRLSEQITEPQSVVLLYAPSGAGKTSLLNTKLKVGLEGAGIDVLPVARLNDVKDTGRAGNPYTAAAIASMHGDVTVNGPAPASWDEYLSNFGRTVRGKLLIVDQLEEILTGPPRPNSLKEEFFAEIGQALEKYRWLRVLFSFREEYLSQMERMLHEYDGECYAGSFRFCLPKLRRDDARIAIEQPALRYGVQYDPDVIDGLLDEFTGAARPGLGAESDEVEPLQLQLVCRRLWSRLPKGKKRISMDQVRHVVENVAPLGSPVKTLVAWAIETFCDDMIEQVSRHTGIGNPQSCPRELIALGLGQFVPGGIRGFAFDADGFTGDLPTPVAEELARLRLLRWEKRNGRRLYELAHDGLIGPLLKLSSVSDQALRDAFARCVAAVAAAQGIDESYLTESCLLTFVSDNATRATVTEEFLEETLQFSPGVVRGLTQAGILRPGRDDVQRSCELSHSRLASALFPLRRSAFAPQHRVRRVLSHHIEECRRTYGEDLRECFENRSQLVEDVDRLVGFTELTKVEAAFTLRSGLALPDVAASGDLLRRAVTRIHSKYPELTLNVLTEAVRSVNSEVRRNAAIALEAPANPDRGKMLILMALTDPSETVRKAAAMSLAIVDDGECWQELSKHLTDPDSRRRADAVTVAAWILDAAQTVYDSPDFDEWFKRLTNLVQRRIRRRVAAARLRETLMHTAIGTVVATASTVFFVAPVRALLGWWGLTITQLSTGGLNGVVESGFLGLVGGVVWGALIGGAILGWWFTAEGRSPCRNGNSGLRAAIVGGAAGFLGGLFISLTLILVYGIESLKSMGWVRVHLSDSFTETGVAWAMPFSGLVVGMSVGFVIIRILPLWQKWMSERLKSPDPVDRTVSRTFGAASVQALSSGWRIVISMAVGALCFYGVLSRLHVGQYNTDWIVAAGTLEPARHRVEMLWRLIGDYIDVGIGGVGLCAGLMSALFLLARGFHFAGVNIPGQREYLLLVSNRRIEAGRPDEPKTNSAASTRNTPPAG